MNPSTTAVPRSGCSSTRPSGTDASTSPQATSTWRGASPLSRFSPRYIASPMTSAILANSAGWMVNPPPMTIHDLAPLMVAPIGLSTASRPSSEAT